MLGRSSEENGAKAFISKTTKRVVRIPQDSSKSTDGFPVEIHGLPTMEITYSQPPSLSLQTKNCEVPHAVIKIENQLTPTLANPKKDHRISKEYRYTNKTLHYVLETYSGFYETETVLWRQLRVENFQAAGKIALLNGHYVDSLSFNLSALQRFLDTFNFDQGEVEDESEPEPKPIENGSVSIILSPDANILSASSSLDSIQQWNEDLDPDQGRESPSFETNEIRNSISQYIQTIKPDPISSVSGLISNNGNIKNAKKDAADTVFQIKNSRTREVVVLASELIRFYTEKIYATENHILMQNILLKSIEFWLSNKLPVSVLERVLLKNMDKYFYPLSILLFCKNFNNNLGEEEIEKRGEVTKQDFLKEFSTKFCLQLCSMVMENVSKS